MQYTLEFSNLYTFLLAICYGLTISGAFALVLWAKITYKLKSSVVKNNNQTTKFLNKGIN